MKKYSQLLVLLIVALFVVEFSGCGYKPSSTYSRVVVGDKISTSVIISAQDPENTVLIKDAVDRAVIEIFRASLVDRKFATTHLTFSILALTYTPIQYDQDGFVVGYRATITLAIARESKDMKKNYKATGTYDFAITANAVITDQERFDAIKFSSQKAIASFLAQISAEGTRVGE